MRRRTHYATWALFAITSIWLGVVFCYSLRTLRRVKSVEKSQKDISMRFESLRRDFARATNDIQRLSFSKSVSSDTDLFPESVEPPFEPRLVGRGQTKSKHARYLYEDWEVADGVVQRRFILRLPLNSENFLNFDSH